MYNEETLYKAILTNIKPEYILTEDTLKMISQTTLMYHNNIQLAYDDSKKEFIKNKDLYDELKSTLDILKSTKISIYELKLKSSIRLIKYQFTDIGIIITTNNLDKIYTNNENNLKYELSKKIEYGHPSKHILFYDNLNVIFRMSNKGYIPLPFEFNIDFLPYEKSPILKLPEFQLAVDLRFWINTVSF